jgi:hypothetical protein
MITILFYVNIVKFKAIEYSFQNISASKQISTQTIYSHVQGLSPVAKPSIRWLPIGSNSFEHCQMIGS